MHLDKRLEAAAALLPQEEGLWLADIGTDHAYLPVELARQGRISRAVAGDIAAGPCQAARTTVALYGMKNKISVRQGCGLEVLRGEKDIASCVIVVAGMGAGTIIEILAAELELALQARALVLQPMAGAALLRQWLLEHGWLLAQEALTADRAHFYELMRAERGSSPCAYSQAELAVGPGNLEKRGPLLPQQFARQIGQLKTLLANMERSEQARRSEKYRRSRELLQELEVLSANVCK